jgi:hypothetical protein
MMCSIAERFTQTDPLNAVAGEPYPAAYVYADNNPVSYVDPSERRSQTPSLQPIKDSGLEKAPDWLLKRAKETASMVWNSSFGAKTTGLCGSLALDVVISFEAQGCFVDDGSRLGSTEFVAAGAGWGGVSLTGSVLLSNANHINDLKGYGICVAGSVAVGFVLNGTGGVELCWGLNGARPLSFASLNPASLSKTYLVSGVLGVSLSTPGLAGHAIFGTTFVQELWKYPRAFKWICGRVIGNPLRGESPVCPG